MTQQRGREPDLFFDHFRRAVARLPAGLIRVMPPAAPAELARAAQALGRPLPPDYQAFLRSFDGADLFHETVLVAGVGPGAPVRLAELPQERAGELVFAVAAAGERYALEGAGRVVRYDAGADERALAGSAFGPWLDATVAREQILYGPDGEYAPDVFDPSGEEVTPLVALRQAERALKQDPGAAGAAHARGLALRLLGRRAAAVGALEAAAALDPDNPWPWFDLGRAALDDGQRGKAVAAFQRAAARVPGPEGARLLAWAARAADGPEAGALRAEALAREPDLVASLRRAAGAAADDQDPEAEAEAAALLAAVAPSEVVVPRRRLPVVREPAAPPPPPARPRRPRPAAPPRSGGRRRGS